MGCIYIYIPSSQKAFQNTSIPLSVLESSPFSNVRPFAKNTSLLILVIFWQSLLFTIDVSLNAMIAMNDYPMHFREWKPYESHRIFSIKCCSSRAVGLLPQ